MALGHKIIFFCILASAYLQKSNYDFRFSQNSKEQKAAINEENQTGFTVTPPNLINDKSTERKPYLPRYRHLRTTTTTTTTTLPPPIWPNPQTVFSITPSTYVFPSDLTFRFSDVGLQRIGRNFIESNSIISLSLDNNNISDISPFAFRSIRNLRHLNLSGNRIPTEKLLSLNGNDKLEMLIINNNTDFDNSNEKKILKEHEIFPRLDHLQLCNSKLENIQVPFYIATPILTHLHLCNNSISSGSAIFDNIPATLTHLNLNDNLIDRVEEDKLRNLQELTMNDNKLTQVCFEECQEQSIPLRGAIKMRVLSLSRNQISEVSSDAFNDMETLITLDLSGNKIANLDKDTFNNSAWINTLSLADNVLATIPNVCPMLNLKSLNLTGNRITAVPTDAFCRLQRLEILHLSDNMITTVELRAFNLQSLMYLDLSGNQLKKLPTLWLTPWRIRDLHFERNYFTELDDLSLKNILSLKNVHLDENLILKVRAESFQSFPGDLTLHLKNIRVNVTQDNKNYDDEDDGDNDGKGNDDFSWG